MMNINKPYLTNFKSFHTFYDVFSVEECNYITSLGWKWQDALTVGREKRNDEIRNSDIFWIEPRNDLLWIWEKLKNCIQDANSHIWRMDLENFHENLQLTRYTKSGHYDWHVDNGNEKSSFRKLSCVLNLTNPYEYDGGGTSIKTGNKSTFLPKEQGSINIFPSYVLHKANKIKMGQRITLVIWVGGSHYK
jgi:PKHD-type hydroxylase